MSNKAHVRPVPKNGYPGPRPVAPRGVPVDGDPPHPWPYQGATLIFRWGDPNLVGGPLVPLVLLVTHVFESGRVNGWLLADPTTKAQGPGGQPVQLPPMQPILNACFSESDKALTWRWPDGADARPPLQGAA